MDTSVEEQGAECADCGQTFPLRQGTGVCPKCEKLKPHAISSPEYSDIAQWPQCLMCGITRRNLPKPPLGLDQTCNTEACKKHARGLAQPPEVQPSQGRTAAAAAAHVDRDEIGESRTRVIAETDRLRAAQTRERLRLTSFPQKNLFVSPLSTATLSNFEHGGGQPNEEKITICWQPRLSEKAKSINGNLGSGTRKIARSVFLADLKAEIVQQINVGWVTSKSVPLSPDDASFRWHGNRLFEKGTATMTVGEFYDHYATPTLAPLFLHNIPPVWKSHAKGKNPVLCLELYIHCEAFERRTNGNSFDENTSPIASTSGRKRLPSTTSETSASKRPRNPNTGANLQRASAIHGSLFSLSTRSGPSVIHSRSKVEFQKIECIIDEETGITSFESLGEEVAGFLRDLPFGCGSMKCAYELFVDGKKSLVLKRFFTLEEPSDVNLPRDDGKVLKKASITWVPVEKNLSEVQAELSRLVMGNWFLKAFYKFARSKGVDVDNDITFANACLMQELNKPSKASGVTDIILPEDGLTWLAEPKRPTTMCRYSGTLTHQTTLRRDLRSMTIYAFVHHAYGHSNKMMVFADLQGTPAPVNGQDGIVLFDPMTHTIAQNSGVGDFGIDGINSFIRDHSCTDICSRLGLDKDIPLRVVTSEDSDHSGGDSDEDTLGQEAQQGENREEEEEA